MSTYVQDTKDDVLDAIAKLVEPDEDDTWTDPYGLLESIGLLLERVKFEHDPSKPPGKVHTCGIIARGCYTERTCHCNATDGHDHDEWEAEWI